MPTNNIAFTPARNIAGAAGFTPPASATDTPTTTPPATTTPRVPPAGGNIAFVPATGRVALDLNLDRFDAPANAFTTTTTVADASTAIAKRDRPILLYNDQCEVCRVLSSWVKAEDAEGSELIDERPIGDNPDALKALDPNLDIWDVYKEIHLLMPDGTVKKGGEAIGEVLKRLPSLKWATWSLDVGVGDFKPFQKILNGAYKVLDAARPAIGCKSCGGGPVPLWALPIKWTADAVRAVRKLVVGDDVEAPAQP